MGEENERLIIIGAGAAGLSAGIHARLAGMETLILEMGHTPGGLCTSWYRNGYRFDGSVAGLAGTHPSAPLHRLWETLGVIEGCPLYQGEDFGCVVLPDGRRVIIHTDIDRLQEHLNSTFIEDASDIAKFCNALRMVSHFDVPFNDRTGLQGVYDSLSQLVGGILGLPTLLRYGRITVRTYLESIKNPDLAMVIGNMVHFGGLDVPMLTLLIPLAYASRRMTGIPVDGWLSFARSMERRFVALGGSIRYNSKVTGLVISNGRVTGVRAEDGSVIEAEKVLTAIDGYYVNTVLLGRAEEVTAKAFAVEMLSDQPVQVNFGIKGHLDFDASSETYLSEDYFEVAGRMQNRVTVHHKGYETGYAPEGCTALTIFLDSDYEWWKCFADDKDKYEKEKARCADKVLEILEKYHHGIRNCIEVMDVSTPITRERYTGNRHGAMQAMKAGTDMMKALMRSKAEYVDRQYKGLYHAGQWVEPWGGITTAVLSGRSAVLRIGGVKK